MGAGSVGHGVGNMAFIHIKANGNVIRELCNRGSGFEIRTNDDLILEVGIISRNDFGQLVEKTNVDACGATFFLVNNRAILARAVEIILGCGSKAECIGRNRTQIVLYNRGCLGEAFGVGKARLDRAATHNGIEVEGFGSAKVVYVAAILFGKLFNGVPRVANNVERGLVFAKNTAADHNVSFIYHNRVGRIKVHAKIVFEKSVKRVGKTALVVANDVHAICVGGDSVTVGFCKTVIG